MSIGKRPNREVARLRLYMGESLDGFALRGITFVRAPVDEILYGFAFDSRPSHGPSRWFHAFGLPLSVPSDFLSLSFGKRVPDDSARGHYGRPVGLGTEDELRETVRIMETEGLEELAKWSTVNAFRRTLAQPYRAFDVHRQFASAVLAAREGDLVEAAWIVGQCAEYVQVRESNDLAALRFFMPEATKILPLQPWVTDVVERMLPLREPCLRGDRQAVDALLDAGAPTQSPSSASRTSACPDRGAARAKAKAMCPGSPVLMSWTQATEARGHRVANRIMVDFFLRKNLLKGDAHNTADRHNSPKPVNYSRVKMGLKPQPIGVQVETEKVRGRKNTFR